MDTFLNFQECKIIENLQMTPLAKFIIVTQTILIFNSFSSTKEPLNLQEKKNQCMKMVFWQNEVVQVKNHTYYSCFEMFIIKCKLELILRKQKNTMNRSIKVNYQK